MKICVAIINIFESLTYSDVLLLTLFFAGVILLFHIFTKALLRERRRRKYLIRSNSTALPRKILITLSNLGILKKVIEFLALRLSIFNSSSSEKNEENAGVLLLASIFIGITLMFVVPQAKVVWYLFLFYQFLALLLILFALYTFNLMVRIRFTSQLPKTFKILNSRFTTESNIVKVIDVSIVDLPNAMRREMTRIRNVLRKNNPKKIEETFSSMEKVYRDEYLTILLSLIRQAYYKGGKESIQQQFEMVTEEIQIDIENQRDLAFTSRMYIVISLFTPFAITWLERFNNQALEEKSVEFYTSPAGMGLKIIIMVALLMYIGILLLLERTA